MKKQTGIWVDSKKAVIVTLDNNNEQTKIIESNLENRIYHDKEGDQGAFVGIHHANNEKKFEERRKHQMTNFLNEITTHITNTDEIYIFGPAETKIKLKQQIKSNKNLIEKLSKVEASDQITLNQIVAKTKDHFKV
ncbi:MAG: hypothetical protein OEV44_14150 [Spirochaetota bacterium]|nr:hypothetical protein [Spirochaetota bacterium]